MTIKNSLYRAITNHDKKNLQIVTAAHNYNTYNM